MKKTKNVKKISLVKSKEFDEATSIIVNGNYYDIGVKVLKWFDKGGFNGYDTSKVVIESNDRRTGKTKKRVIKGKRYSRRKGGLDAIKQIVEHHTGGFTPESCFNTLHNDRKLSVPFLTGDDGSAFQTLDVKENAWHAGKLNPTSVGLENALYPDAGNNPGAYSKNKRDKFGLASHKIGSQYIQGKTREVFLMPKAQVSTVETLTAGIWAALANEKGPIYLHNNPEPPMFMTNEDGFPLADYSPDAKSHVGLLLHANAKGVKWDMAGIPDLSLFEANVISKFYKFLKEL